MEPCSSIENDVREPDWDFTIGGVAFVHVDAKSKYKGLYGKIHIAAR